MKNTLKKDKLFIKLATFPATPSCSHMQAVQDKILHPKFEPKDLMMAPATER